VPRRVLALALFFLAAHLPFLPPSLEDLDSINFALGVRDFDVGRHQPHPPGYPIYIALAKGSTSAFRAAGVHAPEARGLAVWSALAGAAAIPLLFLFFRALDGDERRAWWATLATACAPLFWFTALRPLTDTAGLAVTLASVWLLAVAVTRPPAPRALLAGAFIAGAGIGLRSQVFVLALPLMALALLSRGLQLRERLGAGAALAAGVLAWAVPLVIASGGPAQYLAALGAQGAEDFSGVVMLWTHPTPRVAAYALLHTFVLPWDAVALAVAVLAASAVGLVALLRSWRVLAILAAVFGPYAVFHLLFHETVTVRYALPLVPLFAWLAVRGIDAIARGATPIAATAIAATGLVCAVPAMLAFAREPAPIFRALEDMARSAASQPEAPRVGLHRRVASESRRAIPWFGGVPGRQLPSPRDYEWLELVNGWRSGDAGAAWFLADPARTDLALIDDVGRRETRYRWALDADVYVGGTRPNEMDWHAFDTPGWFLEQGWALTPEIAGITARDGAGPHVRPSVGRIRRRDGEAALLIGGRHLGAPSTPPMRVIVDIDARTVHRVDVEPGFFAEVVTLPAGTLAGAAGSYAPLQVRAEPIGGTVSAVGLEQFDVQSPGVAMRAFGEGWHEPEFNPRTARTWRWASERAVLRVFNTRDDVHLTIVGESPLRYFDRAPLVRVTIGGTEVARFSPDADFSQRVLLPHRLLAASAGQVVLESDQWFSPNDRGESADRRHLALRLYSVRVRP
jgi:hypothetical protein